MVTLAPRGPMEVEMPRREKFRRTPGNSVTRRWKRRLMGAKVTPCVNHTL
jgi:hypothetical protein